ncbi:hypothetical protein LGM43_34895 [Burkholderia seminalis]|uniref:hypothetical protein n=1 Tax=Burkholderia seminalis TaxID=488731 RepID=UPI001CF40990|nr:hypothetical protein [Burkholderia seminalis]MCA7955451.1 hypothetical protein [Burkholderia seminalis]
MSAKFRRAGRVVSGMAVFDTVSGIELRIRAAVMQGWSCGESARGELKWLGVRGAEPDTPPNAG